MLREPGRPGRFRLGQVPHEAVAVVAGVPLVDQREECQGRFVGPAASRLRVDVSEQLTREVEVVLARAVVEEDEFLVLAHWDAAVPVDPARAPGNLTRDEEVRREVEAVSDAGVE